MWPNFLIETRVKTPKTKTEEVGPCRATDPAPMQLAADTTCCKL